MKQLRNFFTLISAGLLALACQGASAQSTTNLRLMPMGDSITAGYLSTTGNGYRGPLFTALSGQVGMLDFVGTQYDGTMADPDNEGHYGDRIDQVASLANAALNEYKPNIVLLLLGINDINQGYQVSTAPDRLGSLIDQILAAEPDATVLVAQLVVNANASTESNVVTFNAALPSIIQTRTNAGKHVALVNMSALTTADLADGLHPNDAGYQLMANAWDPAIETAISNGWIADPVAGSLSHPVGSVYSRIQGKCLDDLNNSGSNGAVVDISACTGGASQQWNINSGNLTINNRCLDIVGGGTANGTKVDLWPCNNAANQVWTYKNGELVNPASGRCLDDPGGSTTNGTQLDIWDCDGGTNQKWVLPVVGPVVSGIAGLCLDLFGGNTANGTKVDIYSCNQSAAQLWTVNNNLLKINGKCLDIKGGGTANGTLVDFWPCNGGTNQVWVPESNGELYNPASGKCLDDPNNSTVGGTQLQIWTCGGGSNQVWTPPSYSF
jgi:lysophospholipase L1-like esterase